MKKLNLKSLVVLSLSFLLASVSFAQNKPTYVLDETTVQKHLPFIEESVDLGMPIYDMQYVVNSLGEFETERTGAVQVKKLMDQIVDEDGRTTFVYLVYAPFVGDEGSTGTLDCEAYVTLTASGDLGYKPALCMIYEWDNERLWDE